MTEEQRQKAFRNLRALFGCGGTVDERDFCDWGAQSVDAMQELLHEFCKEETLAGRSWIIREKQITVKTEDWKTGKKRKQRLCAWTARFVGGET